MTLFQNCGELFNSLFDPHCSESIKRALVKIPYEIDDKDPMKDLEIYKTEYDPGKIYYMPNLHGTYSKYCT